MHRLEHSAGFRGPASPYGAGVQSRRVVLAELTAIAGLSIATVVAVTAVSVGMARAAVGDGVIGNDGGVFAIALVLGLAFIAIGGFAVLMPGGRRHPRH
ncbi:MAG: hypothetical protein KIT76_02965 [Pseudolabrys sp.]|jgi:hypothetical protein|nr:hypothetical protein [Pseudolabrys sp.]